MYKHLNQVHTAGAGKAYANLKICFVKQFPTYPFLEYHRSKFINLTFMPSQNCGILTILTKNYCEKNIMPKQKKQIYLRRIVFISAVIGVMVITWAVIKPKQAEQTQQKHYHKYLPSESTTNSKMALDDVIKGAVTWRPIYTSWYGKPAIDFTLTDIKGKEHKLSDYRGKNVMFVFWATWCGPCLMEIPHLIALRNIISEDK